MLSWAWAWRCVNYVGECASKLELAVCFASEIVLGVLSRVSPCQGSSPGDTPPRKIVTHFAFNKRSTLCSTFGWRFLIGCKLMLTCFKVTNRFFFARKPFKVFISEKNFRKKNSEKVSNSRNKRDSQVPLKHSNWEWRPAYGGSNPGAVTLLGPGQCLRDYQRRR